MFKNYILIAYRSFIKNKFDSVVGIVGFAIGIACFALVSYYVLIESTYSGFYRKANRIVRVTISLINEGRQEDLAWVDTGFLENARNLTGLEKVTGIHLIPEATKVEVDNKVFWEHQIAMTDTSHFYIFDYQWISGRPETAFLKPYSIVLTKSLSDKYFQSDFKGDQIININNQDYSVTGVIDDLPNNSEMIFTGLMYDGKNSMDQDWCLAYVLLKEGIKTEDARKQINKMFDAQVRPILKESNTDGHYNIEKLVDIHVGSTKLFDAPKNSNQKIWLFQSIGLLVLIIASVNYINISFAQSLKRAKEIGVRRVLGASHRDVSRQIYLISTISIAVAIILSMCLFFLSIPIAQDLLSINLTSVKLSPNGLTVAVLIAFGLFVFIATWMPAKLLSKLSINDIIKGEFTIKDRFSLKTVLIVIQVFATSILISTTYTISNQYKMLSQQRLGFNKENSLIVDLSAITEDISLIQFFRNSLLSNNNIEFVSKVDKNSLPLSELSIDVYEVDLPTRKGKELISFARVDKYFIQTLQIPILEGRDFSESDTTNSILINTALLQKLELSDPIGREVIRYGDVTYRIIGVIDDYSNTGVLGSSRPLILHLNTSQAHAIVARYTGSYTDAVRVLERAWSVSIGKFSPLTFSTMTDRYFILFEADLIFARLLTIFSIISIVLSIAGLFGVISLDVGKKKKEVAIRRVLGSCQLNLIFTLAKRYIIVSIVGILASIPVTVFITDQWLLRYSEKVSVEPVYFTLTMIVLTVTIFSVILYRIFSTSHQLISNLRSE